MMRRRIHKGLNYDRKSSKVIQDCTICVSCRWPAMDSDVLKLLDNRHQVAGIAEYREQPLAAVLWPFPRHLLAVGLRLD